MSKIPDVYKELEVILETKFVDPYTLSHVVEMLSVIALNKSAHLIENWQDDKAAQSWARAAELLGAVQIKLEKLGNPAI